MARNISNIITKGQSGKIGNLVLTSDGHLRSRPDVSRRTWSAKQIHHLTKVEAAKNYARAVLRDPEKSAFYSPKAEKKKGLGIWHLAISDYYHSPEIHRISFPGFTGKTGDKILVEASDNFKVCSVNISIILQNGLALEQGFAGEGTNSFVWVYALKNSLIPADGLEVRVVVMDLPGNITTQTVQWPFDCKK